MILDAVTTLDDLRAACAEVDAGRAAAGRTDPYRVVVYIEPAMGLLADKLADVVGRSVRRLAALGSQAWCSKAAPRLGTPVRCSPRSQRRPEPDR